MSRIIPGGFLRIARNLADLRDKAAARENLGLGSAAESDAAAFAAAGHDHDGTYAAAGHDHDGTYAAAGHNHDGTYAAAGHNHDGTYAADDHTHTAADALPAAADGVGAYAMLEAGTASGVATFGQSVADTELLHLDGSAVVTPSTWQCQGDSPAQGSQTLWLRIA